MSAISSIYSTSVNSSTQAADFNTISEDITAVGLGQMTIEQLLQKDNISLDSLIYNPEDGRSYTLFDIAFSNSQAAYAVGDMATYQASINAAIQLANTPGFDPNFAATGDYSPLNLVLNEIVQTPSKKDSYEPLALALITTGATVHPQSGGADWPLLLGVDIANMTGDYDLLNAMIAADPDSLNEFSAQAPYSVLNRAVTDQNVALTQFLLDNGANPNSPAVAMGGNTYQSVLGSIKTWQDLGVTQFNGVIAVLEASGASTAPVTVITGPTH